MLDWISTHLLFASIAAFVIVALAFFGLLYLFFFYFQPTDAPSKQNRKRIKTLIRATSPAQTRIHHSRVITEANARDVAHGDVAWDVRQAAYPEG